MNKVALRGSSSTTFGALKTNPQNLTGKGFRTDILKWSPGGENCSKA